MNTKASIQAALQAGVDWVEFDVRRTKDDKIVLSHDANTFRTTLIPHTISRTTYAKLVKAKTRHKEPITALTEAFATIGGKAKINVEIKSKGCAEQVVDHIERMVKAGAPYSHFLVSSFSVERIREIHRLNSQIQLGLLHLRRPYKFVKLRALRLHAVGFWRKRLPKKAIEQAKIRGLAVYVYTVNNHRDAEKLAAQGVDRIVTDRPDKLQDLRG